MHTQINKNFHIFESFTNLYSTWSTCGFKGSSKNLNPWLELYFPISIKVYRGANFNGLFLFLKKLS